MIDLQYILLLLILVFLKDIVAQDTNSTQNTEFLNQSQPNNLNKNLSEGIKQAFGSCFNPYKYHDKYEIFEAISGERPDVFLWLGDAVYVTKPFFMWFNRLLNYQDIEKVYSDLKYNEHYQTQLNNTQILGIWDDHDSGYEKISYIFQKAGDKHKLREYYLNFIDEPKNSIRWTRSDGIYESYHLDTQKKAKLILLDIWSHPIQDGDALGDSQREWFKHQVLNDTTTEIFIIGVGSPLVNNLFVSGDSVPNYNRKEIFEIINAKNAFFLVLTGEVHFSSQSQHNFYSQPDREDDLYEVISSGMSHYVNPIFQLDNFIADRYNNRTHRYNGQNYATLELLKNDTHCKVDIKINDEKGETQLEKELDCSQRTQVSIEDREGDSFQGINLGHQQDMVKAGKIGHWFSVWNFYIEEKFILFGVEVFALIMHILVHKKIVMYVFCNVL